MKQAIHPRWSTRIATREEMRRALEEHVAAENADDRERVLRTYVDSDPIFEGVPSGQRHIGAEAIVDN